jgi:hypothetical protein
MAPTPEELEQRRAWFKGYVDRLEKLSVSRPPVEGVRYACPCCGCRTPGERGGYEICPVCFWEDDGQDDQDADTVRGGPNGALSLTQARTNYRQFGACERRVLVHVRPPLPEEQP